MSERITDKLVKGLAPPATGNRVAYDDKIRGFGVRVTAKGAKSFVLNYRNADGRERRLTIGQYDDWSVERARKRAKDLRQEIDKGNDPLEQRQEQRDAPTVADLCDRYLDEHARPKKRSAKDDEGLIRQWILPKLGNRKVAAIRFTDIDGLHRAMKATPVRANRCLSLLSKMFSLAVRWEMRADNPCKGVERNAEYNRERYLSAEETERLIKALNGYPDRRAQDAAKFRGYVDTDAERSAGKRFADLVRLAMLTGCREGEALKAQWGQFDLGQGLWIKPAATTKTDKLHHLPLSDAAVALVKEIHAEAPRDDDGNLTSEYLFPGKTPDKPLYGIAKPWSKILEMAEIEDFRFHDLRHSFASVLINAGQGLELIGKLLNHTQAVTTRRYAHLMTDTQRRAANIAAAAINGKSAEVIDIKEGAA